MAALLLVGLAAVRVAEAATPRPAPGMLTVAPEPTAMASPEHRGHGVLGRIEP